MKKLNNLEKSKVRGGGSILGIIQGGAAIIYAIGEGLNLIASWIGRKEKVTITTNNNELKSFINKNDGEQITIFS